MTCTPADGSIFNSSTAGTAQITGGRLQLTSSATGGTSAAYRLPDLDPGLEISEFTLEYDVMLQATSVTPADGYAVSFGAIPSSAADIVSASFNTGEEGFNAANGLVVAFDAYDNGGSEAPAIDAKGSNTIVRSVYMGVVGNPAVPGGQWQWNNGVVGGYPWDGVLRHVIIHWETSTGLDVKITGSGGTLVDVMVDQPVPGFVPSAGNVLAWSARTGGATETVQLDNVVLTTVPILPIQTGGPTLSEMLVDNVNFGEDENCDSGSWVEIYNGQGTAQSLAGWYLTDDAGTPAKWAFPAGASMNSYQYLRVWVDSKNRTTSPYHTSFSMVKTGGYIGLVKPDLSTASSFTYGQQAEDVSYGRLGMAQTQGYLETPTPGAKNSGNQSAGAPTSEEVTFDSVGGLFTTAFTLNIIPPVTAGAVARYTLDNSVPTESSTAWPAGGFNVAGSTQLRVRFMEPGKLGGPVSSRSFTLLDSTLTNYRGSGQPFK